MLSSLSIWVCHPEYLHLPAPQPAVLEEAGGPTSVLSPGCAAHTDGLPGAAGSTVIHLKDPRSETAPRSSSSSQQTPQTGAPACRLA